MEVVALIAGSVGGLAIGLMAGLKWGAALSSAATWRYWAANAATVLVGLAVTIGGQMFGAMWLAVSGVGVVAGGITGLKYGFGRSPGVWAVHDRFLGGTTAPPDGADEDRGRS